MRYYLLPRVEHTCKLGHPPCFAICFPAPYTMYTNYDKRSIQHTHVNIQAQLSRVDAFYPVGNFRYHFAPSYGTHLRAFNSHFIRILAYLYTKYHKLSNTMYTICAIIKNNYRITYEANDVFLLFRYLRLSGNGYLSH
jgi:hypothetical protein